MSNYRENQVPRITEMFKALSNPNRLKIFLRLLACCPTGPFQTIDPGAEAEACACVGELGQDLAIGASTISHHIKELRRAGLIRVERQGQKMECSLDPEALATLRGFFS